MKISCVISQLKSIHSGKTPHCGMKAKENGTRRRSCYSRAQGEGESREAWNEKVKQMLQHSTICFCTSCVTSYYIIKCAEMWNKMCCHLKAYIYVYGIFGRLTVNQLTLVCPNSTSFISGVHCDFFCVKVLSGGAGDWTANPAINGRAALPSLSPNRVIWLSSVVTHIIAWFAPSQAILEVGSPGSYCYHNWLLLD